MLAEGEPGRDSPGWREVPGAGGGAEARRPPDPTRPRQPGQRGRWGRVQRPELSRGWGRGVRPWRDAWPLAAGCRPPTREGADRVRGQLLGWGGWLATGVGSHSLWRRSLPSESLLSLARSPVALNSDLAFLSARSIPTPRSTGQKAMSGFRIHALSLPGPPQSHARQGQTPVLPGKDPIQT